MTYVEVGKFQVYMDPDELTLVSLVDNLRTLKDRIPPEYRITATVTFKCAATNGALFCVVGFERP